MDLKDCKMGILVQGNFEPLNQKYTGKIGHIIGLTLNGQGETIPIVEWAARDFHSDQTPMHHANLKEYK